jgi:hypothetical protein
MEQMIRLSLKEQKEFLIEQGIEKPIQSYKQTDFVKDRVAVEALRLLREAEGSRNDAEAKMNAMLIEMGFEI